MELNREQIIKALECCASRKQACRDCPVPQDVKDDCKCMEFISRNVLALICELTESLDRVQKQCGEIIVECDERDAERLKQVAKLTEECKKWQERLDREAKCQYDLAGKIVDLEAKVAQVKADTLKDVQMRFAMQFGTYTYDAEVKVSDVFKLLSKFKEEMLEGEI